MVIRDHSASSRERAAPSALPEDLPGVPPVVVRLLRRDVEREVNYVRSSWSKSAANNNRHLPAKVTYDDMQRPVRVETMDPTLFFEGHMRRLVPRLLARSTVLVAEPKATPGLVAGWMAFEPARKVIEPGFAKPEATRLLVVHFLYVSNELRRHGVGSLLAAQLPEGPVTYSHWNPKMEFFAGPRGWTYDETRKWD